MSHWSYISLTTEISDNVLRKRSAETKDVDFKVLLFKFVKITSNFKNLACCASEFTPFLLLRYIVDTLSWQTVNIELPTR